MYNVIKQTSLTSDIQEIEEEANELKKDWGTIEIEVHDEIVKEEGEGEKSNIGNSDETTASTSKEATSKDKDASVNKSAAKKKGKKARMRNNSYIFSPEICMNWRRSRGVGQYNNLRAETW